jgi:hypothetical protein
MNTAKPFDLKERTFQFALAILNWAEKCPRNFMPLFPGPAQEARRPAKQS